MRDDRGQLSLMIIGFFVVGVLLVAVVVDVSAAYLRRTSMDNLADGAALAASNGVSGDIAYTTTLQGNAGVNADAARPYVARYLASSGAFDDYPGLRWSVVQDGRTVRVRVSVPLRLPVNVSGFGDDSTVAAESVVRVRLS